MSTKRIEKGFTLIELLVVISIIALLLSIMMPALNMAREQAKTTVCAVNQRSMGLSLRMYEDNNDQKLPPQYVPSLGEVYDREGDLPWYSYLAYAGFPDIKPYQLGKLYANHLIEESELFYCPSQGFKGSSQHFGAMYYTHDYYLVNNVWALDYSTNATDNSRVRLNYNYWLHGKNTLDVLSAKPVVFDMVHHWYSVSHVKHSTPRGINVLYGDGHVTFATNENIFDLALWNGGPDCPQMQGPGHHLNLFEDILELLERQPY